LQSSSSNSWCCIRRFASIFSVRRTMRTSAISCTCSGSTRASGTRHPSARRYLDSGIRSAGWVLPLQRFGPSSRIFFQRRSKRTRGRETLRASVVRRRRTFVPTHRPRSE
jgi:hypothetical protein